MSVRKRPESRFWQYRFKIDGHSYAGSTKETNIGKARQFESLLMARAREGALNPHIRKCPTLAEFSKQFLAYIAASQDLKPVTKTYYANGWRLLSITRVAGQRLNLIGPADAAVLTFPGGGSNANLALRTLRVMLGHACQLDILKAAPRINLRKENKRQAIVEMWVEDLLLEFASTVLRDVIVIMLDCGMRPEEVCRIRNEDIQWGSKALLVRSGKTENAERAVGLTERMADAFKSAKARNQRRGVESAWVFPSSRSGEGHYVSFSNAWADMLPHVNAAIAKRGLPGLPPGLVLYSCRHTFATNFLKASGNNQAALKKLLGHASMQTTERYVHPGITDAAAIMDRFNADRRGMALVKRA